MWRPSSVSTSLFLFIVFGNMILSNAATIPDKRSGDHLMQQGPMAEENGLMGAFGTGIVGVIAGAKSTVDNTASPQSHGTRADEEKAAEEAGKIVGSAIGHALLGR